ncbi:neuroglobin-like [Dendronephthya gigantea]|uniref:neuroglobin-like n=1 Tax=Dendronephthya gigantea TaxID=151771 RepID=UPI00106C6BEB|nr:neuroglobin-like [Dendronephthya gigantea]
MGCQSSKMVITDGQTNSTAKKMSKSNKKIVQEMWFELKPDLKNFGVSIFIRLFEEAPEAQDLFYNFRDLKNQDELIQSLKELDHVARVMNAFGNCIELLEDMEQFSNTVQGLGRTHIKIGINESHINLFGKVVMDLLVDYCHVSWTVQKENAWKNFFGLLSENFAIGLNDTENINLHNGSDNNNHASS